MFNSVTFKITFTILCCISFSYNKKQQKNKSIHQKTSKEKGRNNKKIYLIILVNH